MKKINKKKLIWSLMGLGFGGLVLTSSILAACKKEEDNTNKVNTNQENTKPSTPNEEQNQPSIPNDNVSPPISNEENERLKTERYNEDFRILNDKLSYLEIEPNKMELYVSKLNSLKEYSESNEEELNVLKNDIDKYFEVDPNTKLSINDVIILSNKDDRLLSDLKNTSSYKEVTKLFDNINENTISFEVVKEVYTKRMEVINQLKLLHVAIETLNKRVRNARNKNTTFVNKWNTFSVENRSIEDIKNDVVSVVDEAINTSTTESIYDFDDTYLKLYSRLVAFVNNVDNNNLNVNGLNALLSDRDVLSIQTQISSMFNLPRIKKISETDYEKRLDVFNLKIKEIENFFKNAKEDEMIRWLNSNELNYVSRKDSMNSEIIISSPSFMKSLNEIWLFNNPTQQNSGVFTYFLYFINAFRGLETNLEEVNTLVNKQLHLKQKFFELFSNLITLHDKYGFEYKPYKPNKNNLSWGYDEYNPNDSEESDNEVLGRVTPEMVNQEDSELSNATLFKKPKMFWLTLKKVGGFNASTNALIDEFVTNQNNYESFVRDNIQGGNYLSAFRDVNNGSKSLNTFINELPQDFFDEYANVVNQLKQSYDKLNTNENLKYLIRTHKLVDLLQNTLQTSRLGTRIILDNTTQGRNLMSFAKIIHDVINELQLINPLEENKMTFGVRKEKLIKTNKIFETLYELIISNEMNELNLVANQLEPNVYNQELISQLKPLYNDFKTKLLENQNIEELKSIIVSITNILKPKINTSTQPIDSNSTVLKLNNMAYYIHKSEDINEQFRLSSRTHLILLGIYHQINEWVKTNQGSINQEVVNNWNEKQEHILSILNQEIRKQDDQRISWLYKKNMLFEEYDLIFDSLGNHAINKIIAFLEQESEWLLDNWGLNPIFDNLNFNNNPLRWGSVKFLNNHEDIMMSLGENFISWMSLPPKSQQPSLNARNLSSSPGSESSTTNKLFALYQLNETNTVESFKNIFNSKKEKFNTTVQSIDTQLGDDYDKEKTFKKQTSLLDYSLNDNKVFASLNLEMYNETMRDFFVQVRNDALQTNSRTLFVEHKLVDPQLLINKGSVEQPNLETNWGLFEYIQASLSPLRVERLLVRIIEDMILKEATSFNTIDHENIKRRFLNHDISKLSMSEKEKYDEIVDLIQNTSFDIGLLHKIHTFENEFIYFNWLQYTSTTQLSRKEVDYIVKKYKEILRNESKLGNDVVNKIKQTFDFLKHTKYKEYDYVMTFKQQMDDLLSSLDNTTSAS